MASVAEEENRLPAGPRSIHVYMDRLRQMVPVKVAGKDGKRYKSTPDI
jgi:hypothetical protein